MQLEAIPVEFTALTDGVLNGEEHVLLFLEHDGARRSYGFALKVADARALLIALRALLPEVQQIQNDLRQRN